MQKTLGSIMLLAGVAILFVGFMFPMATIIYPEKFWYSLFPDGAASNPTMLTPSSTIQLKCQLVYYDVQTRVHLPGTYLTWTVQVTIAETGETITLFDEVVSPVEGRYATFLFKGSWTVPDGEGETYTFNWLVILRDNDRVEYGRQTKTTIAKTVSVEPDGYFTINNVKADEQTTHLVVDSLVTMAFVPTKNAEKITSVYVEVWKATSKLATVTLTKTDTQYAGTYTLPDFGTYQFKGFYAWTDSATPIQKMSVVVNMEQGQIEPGGFGFNTMQILGLASTCIGLVLILFGKPR